MASTLMTVAAKTVAGPESRISQAIEALPVIQNNVSSVERFASFFTGSVVTICGAKKSGLEGVLYMFAGGFLILRGATGHCPVSQAIGFSTSDATGENSVIAAGHGSRVDASVVVKRPVSDVYRFWRDLENLPRVMTRLVRVEAISNGQSRWTARGPLGLQLQWTAEMISDEKDHLISWRSIRGSDVDVAGSVGFEKRSEVETEVRVQLKYDPPAGKLGTVVAYLLGQAPQRQVQMDLLRFRDFMEHHSSAL